MKQCLGRAVCRTLKSPAAERLHASGSIARRDINRGMPLHLSLPADGKLMSMNMRSPPYQKQRSQDESNIRHCLVEARTSKPAERVCGEESGKTISRTELWDGTVIDIRAWIDDTDTTPDGDLVAGQQIMPRPTCAARRRSTADLALERNRHTVRIMRSILLPGASGVLVGRYQAHD